MKYVTPVVNQCFTFYISNNMYHVLIKPCMFIFFLSLSKRNVIPHYYRILIPKNACCCRPLKNKSRLRVSRFPW